MLGRAARRAALAGPHILRARIPAARGFASRDRDDGSVAFGSSDSAAQQAGRQRPLAGPSRDRNSEAIEEDEEEYDEELAESEEYDELQAQEDSEEFEGEHEHDVEEAERFEEEEDDYADADELAEFEGQTAGEELEAQFARWKHNIKAQRVDLERVLDDPDASPEELMDSTLELARATEDDEAFDYGTQKSTGPGGYYDILKFDSTYDGGERYYFNQPLVEGVGPRPHGSEVFGFEQAWLGAAQDPQSTRWRALEQFYSANAVRERAAQATIDLFLDEQEEIRQQQEDRALRAQLEVADEDTDAVRAEEEADTRTDWLSSIGEEILERADDIVSEDVRLNGRLAEDERLTRSDIEAMREAGRQIALHELRALGPDDMPPELMEDLLNKFSIIYHHMELIARHRLEDIRNRHLDDDYTESPVNWEAVGALLGRKGENLKTWAAHMRSRAEKNIEQKAEKLNDILTLKKAEGELKNEMDVLIPHRGIGEDPASQKDLPAMMNAEEKKDAAKIEEERTGPKSEHGRMRQRVRDMLAADQFDIDAKVTGESPPRPDELLEEVEQVREANLDRQEQAIAAELTPEEARDFLEDRARAREERRARIDEERTVIGRSAEVIQTREELIAELRELENAERQENEEKKKRGKKKKSEEELREERENANRMRKQEFRPSDFIPYSYNYIKGLMTFPLLSRRTTKQTGKGKIHGNYCLIVVGNGNGLMGVGEGKDMEGFARAKDKALADAVRNMDVVERFEDRTIWTEIEDKLGATRIILRPRPVGFGLACNPYIHQILKAAGIKDISGKVWGSRNPLNVIKTVTRMLHAGHMPVQFGSGTTTRGGRRMEGKQGVRGKDAVERERGRKLVDGRAW